jgi:hypothetical protein
MDRPTDVGAEKWLGGLAAKVLSTSMNLVLVRVCLESIRRGTVGAGHTPHTTPHVTNNASSAVGNTQRARRRRERVSGPTERCHSAPTVDQCVRRARSSTWSRSSGAVHAPGAGHRRSVMPGPDEATPIVADSIAEALPVVISGPSASRKMSAITSSACPVARAHPPDAASMTIDQGLRTVGSREDRCKAQCIAEVGPFRLAGGPAVLGDSVSLAANGFPSLRMSHSQRRAHRQTSDEPWHLDAAGRNIYDREINSPRGARWPRSRTQTPT